MDLESLKSRFIAESHEDWVGLWQLVKAVREKLRVTDPIELRRLTLELIEQLVEAGLKPGQSPYAPGGFQLWPEVTIEAILQRIEREWDALGREPNISDICWFDNPLAGIENS